jgi:RHS repeat-associated protein
VYGKNIDEPLVLDKNEDGNDSAISLGDKRLFYHQNTIYSVFALTDIAANILEGYQYDAYGRQTIHEPGSDGVVDFDGDDMITGGGRSALGNSYLHVGRRLDGETGLYYYRNRYLNTKQGRFILRDPAGYMDGLNSFEYLASNPLFNLDPFGLACCCKKIWVKDAPRDSGIGGIKLGVTAQDDDFAYGFHVRVEATVTDGDDISKCEITQEIFMLAVVYDKAGNRKNWLADATHAIAEVNGGVADSAIASWRKGTETYHKDMDNSRFFPGEWWNKHGNDWLEYSDAPGWGAGARPQKLSATTNQDAEQYLTVKIVCKGTVGSPITARFWKSHSAESKSNAWTSKRIGGTGPKDLPREWP